MPAELLLAVSLILVPLLVLIGLELYRVVAQLPRVGRTEQASILRMSTVISTAQALRSAVQDAERAQRDYFLSAEPRYLAAYQDDVKQSGGDLAQLRPFMAGDSERQRRMTLLANAVDAKLAELQNALLAYQRQGLPGPQALLRSSNGLDPMDAIENLVSAMAIAERDLHARQIAAGGDERLNLAVATLVTALVLLLLTGTAAVLTVLSFRRARDLEAQYRQGERRLTKDLLDAQATLAQAHKMEALGQLTGGVAHDFNNLLMVIRNALTIAQGRLQGGEPQVLTALDTALRNVDRAAMTTSRLLAFARQQPLSAQLLDVCDLINQLAETLRHALGNAISLQTRVGDDLWSVTVDRNQLETALLNLCINARDAMPHGGKLAIEASNVSLESSRTGSRQTVKPGEYVRIAVADTGTGMPESVAQKVFEPFFTTKLPGQGTGLGLSQVYGFVRQTGGHVEIHTSPGAGTTVAMYLPRMATAAAVAGLPPGPPIGESALTTEADWLAPANSSQPPDEHI